MRGKKRASGFRLQATAPEGYVPLVFSSGCELTLEERSTIEAQRKDLWKHGIRKQPMLDQMAFEFGYVICASRAAKGSEGDHG